MTEDEFAPGAQAPQQHPQEETREEEGASSVTQDVKEGGNVSASANSSSTKKNSHFPKYRSRVDIACSILKAALDGCLKSKLASKAYMSTAPLKEYIALLLDNEMLEFNPETRTYHTTEKGVRLLRMYDETKQIFKDVI
jgi:predicted transcriptional regulator